MIGICAGILLLQHLHDGELHRLSTESGASQTKITLLLLLWIPNTWSSGQRTAVVVKTIAVAIAAICLVLSYGRMQDISYSDSQENIW